MTEIERAEHALVAHDAEKAEWGRTEAGAEKWIARREELTRALYELKRWPGPTCF